MGNRFCPDWLDMYCRLDNLYCYRGIYRFDGSIQNWTLIPGYLSQIAAGPNGVAWGLNSTGYIYRWGSLAVPMGLD
jgi:hypothetical protein